MSNNSKTNNNIHKTAVIYDGAKIGANVKIGAFAVIEDDVVVGDNCDIRHHCILRQHTVLGNNCSIGEYSVISGDPQDTSFDTRTISGVTIGDNTIIREYVTINRASTANKNTTIGKDCYLMAAMHCAHDVVVKDNVVAGNHSVFTGHVQVDNNVFVAGGAKVHQFNRIGAFSFVGVDAHVRKDVLPFCLLEDRHSKLVHFKINSIALQRFGITVEQIKEIKKVIFGNLRNRQEVNWDDFSDFEMMKYLQSWLAVKSRTGFYGFISTVKSS